MSAGHAEVVLEGPHLASEVQQKVVDAIAAARASGATRLLVRADAMTGLAPPSLSARHQMIRAWAEAADGAVAVAVVVRPEFVDPQRFGVVTAANFGLRANVFVDAAEAIEWLLAQP